MNNQVGTFEYVTDDYVLAGAKRRLGLRDTTLEDAFLKDLINECVGIKLKGAGTRLQIVTQLQIERVGDVTPRAKLPAGFIRFTKKYPIIYTDAAGMAINGTTSSNSEVTYVNSSGDMEGNQVYSTGSLLGNNYSGPVFTNNTFYENSPFGDGFNWFGTVNVIDGYLYFSKNVIADFVKIAYWGLNVDNKGSLMIPAGASIACEAYACWNWCLTNFTTHGQVAPTWERLYRENRKQARAAYNLADSLEYGVINLKMNSLV